MSNLTGFDIQNSEAISFPCGFPRQLCKGLEFKRESLDNGQYIVKSETEKVLYSTDYITGDDDSYIWYLGYQQAPGKISLQKCTSIAPVNQNIKPAVERDAIHRESHSDQSETDDRQRRISLINKHGSKRSKRQLKLSNLNSISTENKTTNIAVERALKRSKKVSDSICINSVGFNPILNAKKFVPEFNLEAKEASGVYSVSSSNYHYILLMTKWNLVIGLDLIKQLDVSRFKSVLDGIDVLPQYVPLSIRAFMVSLKSISSTMKPGKIVKTLQLLRLLEVLIKLNTIKKPSESFMEKKLGVSTSLVLSLLKKFALENNGEYRTSEVIKTKLQCHICVLSLILWNFRIPKDVQGALSKDLKITPKKLEMCFRQAGCKTAGGNVALKVPLEFPKPAPIRKRHVSF